MKALALAVLLCSCVGAQNLAFYIDPSNGGSPDKLLSPLTAAYGFPDTPVGSVTSTVIRIVNNGQAQTTVDAVYVGAADKSTVRTPNFTVTGSGLGSTIAPGAFKLITFNFTPSTTGINFGYLQASVAGSSIPITTAAGSGTPPQITLSCSSSDVAQCNGATLQPSSTSPIYFGNTLTTNATQIQFTLTNGSTSAINPQSMVSLTVATNNPNSTFALSSLPSTLAPGITSTFTVTFAPGSTGTYQSNLLVGNASYPLQGSGISSVLGDLSSLGITYVDSTGVRLTAQPATPISLGQSIAGATTANSFTFSITNPQTTISAVTVSALSVSGTGFSITQAPSLPLSIAPGTSATFTVTFTAPSIGTFSGVLTVGTRLFALTGLGINSPLPDPSFSIDLQPLVNQKQANLSINFPTAATISAIGTLTMKFTPSVANASDDPAVAFTATNGRQLQIDVANGSTVGKYSGQTAITFQSGTTAGTLTFTLTFPNKAPYSQSYTITPAQVQVTSIKAVRQDPNLVITMTGYDNTYSLGQLGFLFYDTSGKPMAEKPVNVDASSAFKQLFFTSNQAGGAFTLKASFPVKGNVTDIGSVALTMTNSAGTASQTPAFQ
ncbi:MAG: choice-of-anchor D domain-containing protein [Bryobacteraceae bacterium]